MAKKAQPSLQANDHFQITPSDTLEVKDDPNNTTNLYTFGYVHNAGSSGAQIRVRSVDGTIGLAYVNAGQTDCLMVKQIFATSPTPPSDLYLRIGRGGSF